MFTQSISAWSHTFDNERILSVQNYSKNEWPHYNSFVLRKTNHNQKPVRVWIWNGLRRERKLVGEVKKRNLQNWFQETIRQVWLNIAVQHKICCFRNLWKTIYMYHQIYNALSTLYGTYYTVCLYLIMGSRIYVV